MKRATLRAWTVSICLVGLILPAPSSGSLSGRPILVRLAVAGLDRLTGPSDAGIRLLTEVEGGWIAAVDAGQAARLRARRIAFEVLDPDPAGKRLFLVETTSGAGTDELAAFGRTRRIGGRTALFWTDDGREAREVLPAEYSVVHLSLDAGLTPRAMAEAAGNVSRVMGHLFRAPAIDARVAGLVDQVSTAALGENIQTLQNFQTRYASYPGCEQAGDYLYSYFSGLGLETEYDPFTFTTANRATRNIVATLPGRVSPEYIVIVCAHYDSTTGATTGPTTAPGADDNGSGTAAVMEIARILSGSAFDFTLKFVCFSAEEWGLYGSQHFAQEAKQAEAKILGVLNLDMIAYTDVLPEDLDLFANEASAWLVYRFMLCAKQYVALDLSAALNPDVRASDHSPFWDQGYSAVLAIEDYPVKNPYYHKTTDVLATLNLDFAATVTKLVLAVAAGIAQPVLQ